MPWWKMTSPGPAHGLTGSLLQTSHPDGYRDQWPCSGLPHSSQMLLPQRSPETKSQPTGMGWQVAAPCLAPSSGAYVAQPSVSAALLLPHLPLLSLCPF